MVRIAPTIMHRSQLGKVAPAIVTIGSQPLNATIERIAASPRGLALRDDRTANTLCNPNRFLTLLGRRPLRKPPHRLGPTRGGSQSPGRGDCSRRSRLST